MTFKSLKTTSALVAVAMAAALPASAELIQHTDQIAEVKFTGSSYELGQHVGDVAGDQIVAAMGRFDDTLGVMLPGLSIASLSETFDENNVFANLKAASPDAAEYIQGLADQLNVTPNTLLAVGMSDEAILESQSKGGIGFLQEGPAKCTVLGQSDGNGKAWAGANFDYMGVNYTGLIVLNHTNDEGKTKVIQTWAGLIPYGGITVGAQPLLMNTMADEGTARQLDGGAILAEGSVPSYHLSWEAYNASNAEELADIYQNDAYTAYFSYILVDQNGELTNFENGYDGTLRTKSADRMAHSNNSVYVAHDFVDDEFGAKSKKRQKAADKFIAHADITASEEQVKEFLHSKPLWKGRGELMGTVTSTYFTVDGDKVDMSIYTDLDSKPVVIKNY